MDINRRHLIGASAAGVAGALAMSPDAARAAPLTSTLGRDVTQYGVRPGSPDDQTRETATRDRRGRTRASAAGAAARRLSHRHAAPFERHATGRRARRDQTHLHRRRLDAAGRRRRPCRPDRHHLRRRRHSAAERRGLVHCLGGRDVRIADCEIIWQRRQRHLARTGLRRHLRQYLQEDRDHGGGVVRRARPDRVAQHHHRHQRQRHRDPAHGDRRRRHARRSTTASRTSRPAPAAPANTATPSTPSAPAM